MPKLRVHNFSVSLDGYAAGPDQSLENPIGVNGGKLHEWVFATHAGRQTLERAFEAAGYECVELVSSPAAVHVKLARTP